MTDFRKADISKQESYDLLRDWIKLVARHTNPDQDISELLGWLWKLKPATPDPITGLVPCDFCTDTFGQKPLLQENKYKPYTCMMSTISIEENNGKHQIEIDLWDGGNVYAAFEINYCPMCGRKLTAPPRPGAIGPETGEMAPNGDEGAEL